MTTVLERLATGADRVFDRLRHPDAFSVREDEAVHGDLGALRGYPYALLVTYRRDGRGVPTPVWFALDPARGVAYVKTRHDAGKTRRLRQEPSVLFAGCTARGRPRTRPFRATGRILEGAEWGPAEDALAESYGLGRRLSEVTLGGGVMPAYLEIRP